ncbi:Hypothetical protein SMAX5B_003935 [Scophthalmus maximus]|uniref:Uncharacterized protein n=1 Tax=Scophthalmus maximus TaxID=52904 RepID=A0A2U9AVH5_SCOMX|nr:Hypothetical protein SMAX5B_003935 [Scophthalmus maximus]
MKRLLFLHYLQDINRNKRVERVARDKAAEGSKPDSVASSSVRLRLLPLIYNPLSRRNQELHFPSACQRSAGPTCSYGASPPQRRPPRNPLSSSGLGEEMFSDSDTTRRVRKKEIERYSTGARSRRRTAFIYNALGLSVSDSISCD